MTFPSTPSLMRSLSPATAEHSPMTLPVALMRRQAAGSESGFPVSETRLAMDRAAKMGQINRISLPHAIIGDLDAKVSGDRAGVARHAPVSLAMCGGKGQRDRLVVGVGNDHGGRGARYYPRRCGASGNQHSQEDNRSHPASIDPF
jgi:hypothetical protein